SEDGIRDFHVTGVQTCALPIWLLRSPQRAADLCRRDGDLRPLVLTSLIAITVGGVAFGAEVGSFRGGLQAFYAAVKLPLAMVAEIGRASARGRVEVQGRAGSWR